MAITIIIDLIQYLCQVLDFFKVVLVFAMVCGSQNRITLNSESALLLTK